MQNSERVFENGLGRENRTGPAQQRRRAFHLSRQVRCLVYMLYREVPKSLESRRKLFTTGLHKSCYLPMLELPLIPEYGDPWYLARFKSAVIMRHGISGVDEEVDTTVELEIGFTLRSRSRGSNLPFMSVCLCIELNVGKLV